MSKRKNTDYIDELNSEFNLDSEESKDTKESEGEDFRKLLGESLKTANRKFSVGDRVKGKILVIGSDDVYVALGAQNDGVLPKKDLFDADGKCPYKVGDVIDLFVTQVRGSEVRVSRNPTDRNVAEDLEDAFDMELPITGRIVEVCKGGVRVNIKGKLAFCPISQIEIKHIESADEYVGRSFDFRITKFEEGGRNIVVSRRKLLEEERELNAGSFLEENSDGAIVDGRVVRLEKYGAFVELAPGVDGLVHISEIAWSRIGEPSEVLQVNQPIKVKILKRETVGDKVKIALSIKQAQAAVVKDDAKAATLAEDPWSKYSIGQVIKGKVTKKEPFGLFVQLEPGITGLLHKSRTVEHPEFHLEKVRVGDELLVQLGQISKEERRISLELPRDPEEHEWKNHVPAATGSLGSLGGAFGAKLQAALDKKKK